MLFYGGYQIITALDPEIQGILEGYLEDEKSEYLKNSEKIKGKWRLMWFVSNEKFIPDDFPRKDVIYLAKIPLL